MRRILAILLVLAPALAAQEVEAPQPAAAADDAAPAVTPLTPAALIGLWRFVEATAEGVPEAALEAIRIDPPAIAFLADGTMRIEQHGASRTGHWRIDGGRILGRSEGQQDEEPVDAAIVSGRLELRSDGMSMVLRRAE